MFSVFYRKNNRYYPKLNWLCDCYRLSLLIPLATLATLPINTAQAEVIRGVFTTGIANREPINNLKQVSAGQDLFYFSEVRALAGHQITHNWDFNGHNYLQVPFTIQGERWRVYSQKVLPANMIGTWVISVLDNTTGQLLQRSQINILAPRISTTPVINTNKPSSQPERAASSPSVSTEASTPSSSSPSASAPATLPVKPSPLVPTVPPNYRPIWEVLPR